MASGAGAAPGLRLLLDEMWPPSIAEALRKRGHDVVAVAERPELRGQRDDAIYRAAWAEERALVTENVADFRPLAAADARAGRPHPPLVFTSNRTFPRGNARTAGRLVAALDRLITGPDAQRGEHWL